MEVNGDFMALITKLCTMPRDRVAARIGTFACRAFPRDTKASKRAKFVFQLNS
ncbi:MAG: hypothetical protein ACKO96_37175 [Flammeovirgaceae bacterium]